jgi:Ohr subfamily peroxiredoxin
MTKIDTMLHAARTHTTGGRDGTSRSDDGRLDMRLSSPGPCGLGTNPEPLFAAGCSACFEGAMGLAARRMNAVLPADPGMIGGAYFLQARPEVSLSGMERTIAQTIIDAAQLTCPYSTAIRDHIQVVSNLI